MTLLLDLSRTALRRVHDEDSGAIAIMAAVLAVALVLSASLAVDVGRVAATSRDLQGAADRAALDGVKVLRDAYRSSGTVDATTYDAVVAEVDRSLEENGFPTSRVQDREVVLGFVEAGETGFQEVDLGTEPEPNAVRVDVETFQDYVLALGVEEGGRDIPRTGVAASDAIASLSVGSTTASVEQDLGLVNDLLGGLLGSPDVDLDLVGYEGMANTHVDLPLLAGELGVGSVQELLTTELTAGELLDGMIAAIEASALEADGEDAVLALEAMNAALEHEEVVGLPPIQLGEVLDVDTGGSSGAEAGVDAFSLTMASLMLANSTGDEDADCQGDGGNALALDLDVSEVGDVCLNLIEPPVIAIGPAHHTVAETAQTRLDVDLLSDGLADLDLGLLNVSALDPLTVSVRTGEGRASLAGTECRGDGRIVVDAELSTASVTVPTASVLEVSLAGITTDVSVSADVDDLAGDEERMTFVGPEWPSERQRLEAETSDTALAAAVVDALEVDVDLSLFSLVSIGIGTGELTDAVEDELALLLEAVDGDLVGPLAETLGLGLGSVDVRALDLECDGRRLLPLGAGDDVDG